MLRVTKEGVKQGVNLFRINNNNKEMTQLRFNNDEQEVVQSYQKNVKQGVNRNIRTRSSNVVLVLLLLTLNKANTFFSIVTSLNIILIAVEKRVDI